MSKQKTAKNVPNRRFCDENRLDTGLLPIPREWNALGSVPNRRLGVRSGRVQRRRREFVGLGPFDRLDRRNQRLGELLVDVADRNDRSEENTSELPTLMSNPYAVIDLQQTK